MKPLALKDLTPEQRKIRNKQNQASIARYEKANYDKVMVRIRKDGADGLTVGTLKDAAAREGQSVNSFILDAIRDKL